jgi:hypothetical protein
MRFEFEVLAKLRANPCKQLLAHLLWFFTRAAGEDGAIHQDFLPDDGVDPHRVDLEPA